MKIPPNALIPTPKLTAYLLTPREVDDKAKFLAQGGFMLARPHELEAAIRDLVEREEAIYDLEKLL